MSETHFPGCCGDCRQGDAPCEHAERCAKASPREALWFAAKVYGAALLAALLGIHLLTGWPL